MRQFFPLAPRYRLDDESPWLRGVDPSRHYWVMVNGDAGLTVVIPGLAVTSLEEWKATLKRFRQLEPGEEISLTRAASSCVIHCISENCFAIATEIAGAPVWHLFDQESLESLLRTAHPDWQCAPGDLELGRQMLTLSWQQPVAA